MEEDKLKKDKLIIAKKKFVSRLIVGTGKYKSMSECAKAIKFSGAEIVTVAVRRVNISNKNKPLYVTAHTWNLFIRPLLRLANHFHGYF